MSSSSGERASAFIASSPRTSFTFTVLVPTPSSFFITMYSFSEILFSITFLVFLSIIYSSGVTIPDTTASPSP